ncbi:hypothetical protein EB815_31815 [Mesorhizobium loti]|nr:hypothetical protein EB815_31815 [Mesorhizobium loti]
MRRRALTTINFRPDRWNCAALSPRLTRSAFGGYDAMLAIINILLFAEKVASQLSLFRLRYAMPTSYLMCKAVHVMCRLSFGGWINDVGVDPTTI